MRPLTARDLIEIWEAGEDQHPLDRALTLLAAASPELTWEELAALSVGQRDARLLALRERTCGPRLICLAECPRCAQRLEFEVAASDLRAAEPDGAEDTREFVAEGVALRFRLPDSHDLASILGLRDPAAARGLLVRRCVLRACRDGTPVEVGELPSSVVAGLAERISECDPQAEVLLALRCPECEHAWQALFDIVSFFWAELAARATRLLREVHDLARAYGWSEADILGMSARRRRFYLEMTA